MFDDMPVGLGGQKSSFMNIFSNPLVASTGLNLLGGLISSFSNRGAKRRAESDFRQAKGDLTGLLSEIDQSRLDPEVGATYANRAVEQYGRRYGDQIDDSLGLDTGLGQGALANMMLPQMTQNRAQAYDQAAAHNKSLLRMKAEIRRLLFGEASQRNQQYA
ncbi:MAG: hypothetical protein P1R58_11730 [bacterium]|nr:hypothetical protein [bacterium]